MIQNMCTGKLAMPVTLISVHTRDIVTSFWLRSLHVIKRMGHIFDWASLVCTAGGASTCMIACICKSAFCHGTLLLADDIRHASTLDPASNKTTFGFLSAMQYIR